MHHHVHIQTLWLEEIAPPTEWLPIRDNLETVDYFTLNSDIQKHYYEQMHWANDRWDIITAGKLALTEACDRKMHSYF